MSIIISDPNRPYEENESNKTTNRLELWYLKLTKWNREAKAKKYKNKKHFNLVAGQQHAQTLLLWFVNTFVDSNTQIAVLDSCS